MLTPTQRARIRDAYRRARDEKGLSAQEVAARAGLDNTLYSRIENSWRRPTPAQAVRLSRVLGLRPLPGLDAQQ